VATLNVDEKECPVDTLRPKYPKVAEPALETVTRGLEDDATIGIALQYGADCNTNRLAVEFS